MFCEFCGNQLVDGSGVCRFCGTSQVLDAAPPLAATGALMARAARAEFLRFRLGERLILIGAALAAVSFFLPWVSVPGGAEPWLLAAIGSSSIDGPGVMKIWGGVVVLLLLPVLSLVLLFMAKSASLERKILLAGVQVWIGTVFGPQILISMLLVPMAMRVLALGAWGLGMGYSCILAGGLVALADLGHQREASRLATDGSQAGVQQGQGVSLTPSDWYPDPTGRFELRFWDGKVWTEHVANQGKRGADPIRNG